MRFERVWWLKPTQGQQGSENVTTGLPTYTAFAKISADAQHRYIPSIRKMSVHALLAHDNADRVRRLGRICLLVLRRSSTLQVVCCLDSSAHEKR